MRMLNVDLFYDIHGYINNFKYLLLFFHYDIYCRMFMY